MDLRLRTRRQKAAAAIAAAALAGGGLILAGGVPPVKEGPLKPPPEPSTTTTTTTTTTTVPPTTTTTVPPTTKPPVTTSPPTTQPAKPRALVVDHKDNYVVPPGTYQSIKLFGSKNVDIGAGVVVDNAGYTGDPLQAGGDCLYVVNSTVNYHDAVCRNAHRQGVAVIWTAGTVTVQRVRFENVARHVVDLEPNRPDVEHVHVFVIRDTVSVGASFGWLVRHTGCCDSVTGLNNIYRNTRMPDGNLPVGYYGRCNRPPGPVAC